MDKNMSMIEPLAFEKREGLGESTLAKIVRDMRSAARIGATSHDYETFRTNNPEQRARLFRRNHPEAAKEASAAWSRLLTIKQKHARETDAKREVRVLVQPMFEEWE